VIRDLKNLALTAGLGLGFIAGAVRPAAANFDWAGHVELDAEGLSSDDAATRLGAVSELRKYDLALTQAYLIKALGDPDGKVKMDAARALGHGSSTAAVPTMIEWLTDPNPLFKQVAADVLGDIGGPEATSALTRSLGDSDSTVRTHAVKALGLIGRHGNPAVVIALLPRLEDDKADVRIATIAQLEELGDLPRGDLAGRAVQRYLSRGAALCGPCGRQARRCVGGAGADPPDQRSQR